MLFRFICLWLLSGLVSGLVHASSWTTISVPLGVIAKANPGLDSITVRQHYG